MPLPITPTVLTVLTSVWAFYSKMSPINTLIIARLTEKRAWGQELRIMAVPHVRACSGWQRPTHRLQLHTLLALRPVPALLHIFELSDATFRSGHHASTTPQMCVLYRQWPGQLAQGGI